MILATLLLWLPVMVVSDYLFCLLAGPRLEAFKPRDEEHITRLFPPKQT